MADVVKNKNTLQMVVDFADGDNRTISVDNPNTAINLGACIDSLSAYVVENNILISDKSGAACTGISDANIFRKTNTKLDLTE